jgi:hypothetical protein
VLRTVADARCLSHFGFAPRCAELRGFTLKTFQTVEMTVNDEAVLARARGSVRGSYLDISHRHSRRVCNRRQKSGDGRNSRYLVVLLQRTEKLDTSR